MRKLLYKESQGHAIPLFICPFIDMETQIMLGWTYMSVALLSLVAISARAEPAAFLPPTATISTAVRSVDARSSHDLISNYYDWEEQGLGNKSQFERDVDYLERFGNAVSRDGVSIKSQRLVQDYVGPFGKYCVKTRYDAEAAEFVVTCGGNLDPYQMMNSTVSYGGAERDISAFCVLHAA